MNKQTNINKINEYLKANNNSFYNEIWDYITDNSIEYTELKDCIDDVLKDPNGLLLADDEYIALYDKFEDEILACLNDDDFNNLFKKLPTVKDYKVTVVKNAIDIILITFINIIGE